jgi:hypothetical protein
VNNPEVRTVEGQTTSFSAQATLLLVFGQDPELKSVDKAKLEELLLFERFPEGYTPTTAVDFVPFDVLEQGTLAQEIRLEFVESFTAARTAELPDLTSTPTSAPTSAPTSGVCKQAFQFLSAVAFFIVSVLAV